MVGGGVLIKGVCFCSDFGRPRGGLRAGIRRPAGSVDTGRKMPFVPAVEGRPTESIDGRGPNFSFGLYSYAIFRSLVLGRVD